MQYENYDPCPESLVCKKPKEIKVGSDHTINKWLGRENQTLCTCNAVTFCNLWFILFRGLPHILSKLSQFVLDYSFNKYFLTLSVSY